LYNNSIIPLVSRPEVRKNILNRTQPPAKAEDSIFSTDRPTEAAETQQAAKTSSGEAGEPQLARTSSETGEAGGSAEGGLTIVLPTPPEEAVANKGATSTEAGVTSKEAGQVVGEQKVLEDDYREEEGEEEVVAPADDPELAEAPADDPELAPLITTLKVKFGEWDGLAKEADSSHRDYDIVLSAG
jgi:hypothetical protein